MNPQAGLTEYPLERLKLMHTAYQKLAFKDQWETARLEAISNEIKRRKTK